MAAACGPQPNVCPAPYAALGQTLAWDCSNATKERPVPCAEGPTNACRHGDPQVIRLALLPRHAMRRARRFLLQAALWLMCRSSPSDRRANYAFESGAGGGAGCLGRSPSQPTFHTSVAGSRRTPRSRCQVDVLRHWPWCSLGSFNFRWRSPAGHWPSGIVPIRNVAG